ncbi:MULTISPECIES: restriction endonuclease subunit S [Bacillus]|uniref:restriction endonuclease subunit S n=1 Tax=Bacillus TaxID=1386 RepID=UPI001CCEBB2B|nr:restriction endonuclease subunit S [Bacillus sp. RAR_M1_44]MCA0162920.1 restriction endonuclease subunit S [Bacillus sp. RAR_M1_44]
MIKKKQAIEELLEGVLVPEDEQPFLVPENWIWVRTQTTNDIVTGSTPAKKKSEYYGGDFPFVKPADLEQGSEVIHASEYLTEEGKDVSRIIPKESTMVCCIGSIGKAGFNTVECTTNQQINSLVPNKKMIDPKFNYYQILNGTYQNELWNRSSATTVSIINKGKMSLIPYVFPPLNEQKRIAEKVERLLSKVDEAKQLIEEAKKTFELRRAAILDKAFRGDLTRKWREENQCDKLEPIEQSGNIGPFKLPHGWEWKKLGEIGELQRGKSKHRPRNDPKLFGGDYPFIQTGDIARSSDYVEDFSQTLSEFGYNQSKLFPIGTVCITIAANIADTAILKFPCCFPDSVVGFVPFKEIVSSEFVHYYISTIKNDLEHYAPATAQKNINLKILNEVLVPVPSLKEHDVIMHKIKSLLDKEYEASQYLSLEKSIELLKKSLLSKAFRGELGTNDLIEESCIELLKEVLQQNLN